MSANLNALKDTLCQWDNFGYASSVLVVFGFQMLWYGPRLMGNVWEKAKGVERQNPDRQTKMTTALMYFFMSLVVGYLADATGTTTAKDALLLGAVLWLGFALPLAGVQHANNPSGKMEVLLIDLTGQLVWFMAQAVCLVYFRHCDLTLDFWKGFMPGAAVEADA